MENNGRFYLATTELYNPILHGENDYHLYTHYLVDYSIKNIHLSDYLGILKFFKNKLIKQIKLLKIINNNNSQNTEHPVIKNYLCILNKQKNNVNFDIIQKISLIDNDGFEVICAIKKTYLIKLIQRRWRNILSERKKAINLRCNPKSIIYREINGKWNKNCFNCPSLYGMINF